MNHRSSHATALLVTGLIAGHAHAQAPVAEEVADLQEVIVSARKRDERLQDVPLTITAVTSATISAGGIGNVAQLSNITPGFHYEKDGTRQMSQPRIRGMEINTANPARQNASFFIDGVYMPGSVQSLDFSEFERIEVIKGPQSALFGRQTFGGAVNFISKVPRNDLEADASATFGSNDLREYSGSISGGLVDDKLFARLHLRSYDYSGAYRNSLNGERLGEENSFSGSASITWMPVDALRMDLRYTRQEDDDSPSPLLMVGAADLNCGPFVPGGLRFYCGALPTGGQPALNTVAGPNALGISEFGFDRTAEMLSLKASYAFAGHDLAFIAAKYKEDNSAVNDLDFTGVPFAATATLQDFDDRSFELRLASDGDGRLSYVAGVYWYKGRFDERVFGRAADLSDIPATLSPDRAESENIAAFASLSYELTDRLNGSIEVRYQEDEVTNIGGQGAARRTLSAKTDAWLPRAILDFKVTDEVMVYGVYSEGNKPQQFNANIAGLPQAQRDYISSTYGVGIALDEERLKNYELGLKSSWLDGRMIVNAAAFLMKWNDQVTRRQVFPSAGSTTQINVVDNAGSTEIKGVEVESHFAVTPAMKLDATFSYIKAEYTNFNSANVQQVYGDAQAAGKEAARFPKVQGSFAASYTFELPSDWSATLRLDESYMGKRWTDEVNLAYAEAYWRTNVRGTLSRGPFSGTVYVENLTDDDGLLMATRFRDVTVPGNNFSFPYLRSEGRKWGVTLRYTF
ncbi:MAG: TonB-dependent receptor [Sinobacteraceae bacterium]|nr:TonB-dependent receptor [Nevskiaceae bacterium]MCP5360122.1 TonB-dependent receptor [Nevskiaceae bacterium]